MTNTPTLSRSLRNPLRATGAVAAIVAAAFAMGGCSGGSDADSAQQQLFGVLGTNVSSGQTWQINREIVIEFTAPIDFASVSMNTVGIAQAGGGPAVGEFFWSPAQPNLLRFQPTCPTQGDFSDAGLKPGGVQYEIDIPSAGNASGTILSATGKSLTNGRQVPFATPVSEAPTALFLDPVPGPPTPVPGTVSETGVVKGTRLRAVEDGAQVEIPFEVDESGLGTLGDYLVPLNFYSDPDTRFEVIVEFNQPVNPSNTNLSQERLQLQFLVDSQWRTFSTDVDLVANCTESGSTVVLRPQGVLPLNRDMRVFVATEFEDLLGDRNVLPLTGFAMMRSRDLTDANGMAIEYADEFLEEFIRSGTEPGSFEDVGAASVAPKAQWGDGELQAAFAFVGTGGPGGDFDWHVPPNSEVVFDTSSQLVLGGPNGLPTGSQTAVGGLINLRNLRIPASSTLRVQGPNPAVFLCAGTVTIQGRLTVNGGSAQPIFTLNTPYQPEPGAAGNAGGGDGGTASYLVTTSTPRGGPGNGAWNSLGGGGEGGEGGWNPGNGSNGEVHRAAGGGGGALGEDELVYNADIDGHCVDQTLIGLDLESGFPGATQAMSTIDSSHIPWGGMGATLPFVNENPDDNFWGVMRKNFGTPEELIVTGELIEPWPASGGGAGGDGTFTATYPPPMLINNNEDKGCGGGGGAGALSILALGNIIVEGSGTIEGVGGHGSGGENTYFVNRVGGGSGGGGGAHIILQTASQIDLSGVPANVPAVFARGGQGGAGASNGGGADETETVAAADAKHIGGDPNGVLDNPWIPPVPAACQFGLGVVRAAGGDGGPGIIQFHVGTLPDDVIPPAGGSGTPIQNIPNVVKPVPVGFDRDEFEWVDQLMPAFGRFSQSQTKWVPLGGIALDPETNELNPIEFLFSGLEFGDPQNEGRILTENEKVPNLEALLAPPAPIEAEGLPSVSETDPRTMVMDASELVGDDEIYRANPALLREFRLVASGLDFDVQGASYDLESDSLSVTVSSQGPTLPLTGAVSLIPRYFSVSTSTVADEIPDSAAVFLTFQATTADAQGDPSLTEVVPGLDVWTGDISVLNEAMLNPEFQFFRVRVQFDIANDEAGLAFDSPRPSLEFFRLPFRF